MSGFAAGRFFEEALIRQHVAVGAKIAVYAGILDDYRAQEDYQFGLGARVVAMLE